MSWHAALNEGPHTGLPGSPTWLGPGWVPGPPVMRTPSRRAFIAKGISVALIVIVVGSGLVSLAGRDDQHRRPVAGAAEGPTFDAGVVADLDALPRLDPAACRFMTPRHRVVTCRDLLVPQVRGEADKGVIRLHVAVYASEAADPAPDPVLYLSGGPGGVALIDIEDFGGYPFLADRDLIVIDQRGTGSSVPSLDCAELDDLDDPMTSASSSMRAVRSCRDRLRGLGIELAAYSSAENAADLADLRVAMGIDEWNLYGISYGTRLALTLLRDRPQGVRSVILDAVYPPEAELYQALPANAARAFDALLDGCAQDDACEADHPDLKARFYALGRELDARPRTVRSTALDEEWSVNGMVLFDYVFESLYDTQIIPSLPASIDDIVGGDDGPLVDYLELTSIVRRIDQRPWDIAEGMYLSVQCPEEFASVPARSFEDRNASVQPEVVNAFHPRDVVRRCEVWDVPGADPHVRSLVTSKVPTLLLTGEFDPITPPAWAHDAARGLAGSKVLTFPGTGHGVLYGSSCAGQITDAFLDDPAAGLDTTCLEEMAGPPWVP